MEYVFVHVHALRSALRLAALPASANGRRPSRCGFARFSTSRASATARTHTAGSPAPGADAGCARFTRAAPASARRDPAAVAPQLAAFTRFAGKPTDFCRMPPGPRFPCVPDSSPIPPALSPLPAGSPPVAPALRAAAGSAALRAAATATFGSSARPGNAPLPIATAGSPVRPL